MTDSDLLWRAFRAIEDYHRDAVRRSREGGYVPSCDTPEGCDDQRLLREIAEAAWRVEKTDG